MNMQSKAEAAATSALDYRLSQEANALGTISIQRTPEQEQASNQEIVDLGFPNVLFLTDSQTGLPSV